MDERRRVHHNGVIDVLELVRREAEDLMGHALSDWSYSGMVDQPQLVARCKRCGAVALVDYLVPALVSEASLATRFPCLYDYAVSTL